MSPEAWALHEAMEAIAARAYPSGRQQHLEFVLWYALIHGPMEYGRTQVSREDIQQLRDLSDACGGWIVMAKPGTPRWLQAAEWQDLFTRKIDLVRLG